MGNVEKTMMHRVMEKAQDPQGSQNKLSSENVIVLTI